MSSDEQIRHSSKSYPGVGSRLLSERRKTRTTDGITSIDAAIIEGDSVNRGKRGKNHPTRVYATECIGGREKIGRENRSNANAIPSSFPRLSLLITISARPRPPLLLLLYTRYTQIR